MIGDENMEDRTDEERKAERRGEKMKENERILEEKRDS